MVWCSIIYEFIRVVVWCDKGLYECDTVQCIVVWCDKGFGVVWCDEGCGVM